MNVEAAIQIVNSTYVDFDIENTTFVTDMRAEDALAIVGKNNAASPN